MVDFSILDVAARFRHFKPTHIPNRLFGPCNRVRDGVFNALGRRTDQFDLFVDVIAHAAPSAADGLQTNTKFLIISGILQPLNARLLIPISLGDLFGRRLSGEKTISTFR